MSKLKIGNIELNSNIILGPMAGLTDRPFRLVCEKFNPGLVVTEMVSAKAIFYNDENTKKLMVTENEKHPIAIQIFGSDEESMSFAAKYPSGRLKALPAEGISKGCFSRRFSLSSFIFAAMASLSPGSRRNTALTIAQPPIV